MRSRRLACAAVVFAMLTAGRSHAGSISWGFDWTGSTKLVAPDPFSATSFGSGSITMVGQKGTGTDSQTITAVNLATISSASSTIGPPDRYTDRPYTLKVDLTDTASNQSKVLTFSGLFNGTVTATKVSLSTVFTGSTSLSAQLGGNTYVVSIGPFSNPSGPGDPADGSGFIHASVRVTAGDTGGGGGGIHNTPEPSSLVLTGIGMVHMACWYRRRRAAKA